jgi:cytochrome c oxidase accessory protein FixG
VKASYLSKENLIFKEAVVDDKIYVREQKGVFQRIRRSLGYILMLLFILVPFIKHNNTQAVIIDLQQQKLHVFSLTLLPQDLFIVSLVLMFFAFLLFYITQLYGRVWCGFTCPQTIWMLMFNWVERRVEGTHHHSKALNAQPFTLSKLAKKIIKHAIWTMISLFTALVFISYFVPVNQLYKNFFMLEASSLVISWVLFFAVCTYINAGWIREKMCQHMCPYSRIQSAMFDKSTKLVTYDEQRGESRGKRKRSAVKDPSLGDCVDCNLCVQVCPVGIDIRDGLQYECINCGLCVDACDMTMEKFNYEKGLIAFKSSQVSKGDWKRHLSYGGALSLIILGMLIWLQNWQSFEVNVARDRQALYRVNYDGSLENTFVLKVRNKSAYTKVYQVDVEGIDNVKIKGLTRIEVLAGELKISAITVLVDTELERFKNNISFNILDQLSLETAQINTSFYSDANSRVGQ